MQVRIWLVGLSVVASFLGSAAARAADSTAAREFARGQELLAKADLDGALAAFKAAARAEPENEEYFQELALLRRILNLREQLATEKDPELWQTMALGLWTYYDQHKIHGAALDLARTMHQKLRSSESAVILAESHLNMGQPADAAALLGDLPGEQRTALADALHGVALARVGKLDQARVCAERVELPKDCDARLCFSAARLYALTGATEKALAGLKCALEATPPAQLAAFRATLRTCPDLGALAQAESFTQVLATESKVKAGCGSAAACGKCPAKDKGCGKEPEKAREGEKQPGCSHGT